ncbi:MAG: hypothetical protein R2807_01830 [Chitinophagales bacterium]
MAQLMTRTDKLYDKCLSHSFICGEIWNVGRSLTNGLDDLKNGIIRTPLNPSITFDDDPLHCCVPYDLQAQLNFK